MKKGFTFVEILLAIVIIGVISALVIPILYNSYSKRVLVTKLKKVTTQIVTAAKTVISDERAADVHSLETITTAGTLNTGFYFTSAGVKTSNSTQGVQYFLNNYFKTSRTNCGTGSKKCVGANYKSSSGKNLGTIPSNYYCVKTVNSAAICMAYLDNWLKVIVDINAEDKPNVTGVDTFSMYIDNDGDLKDISPDPKDCDKEKTSNTILDYAAGCFSKVIGNGWRMCDGDTGEGCD